MITVPGDARSAPKKILGAPPSTQSGVYVIWIVLAILLGGTFFCVVGMVGCGVFGFSRAIVPAMGTARQAAKRVQCTNNLKQIALALHNYHDVNRRLPPAYSVDEDGNRLHSWRVLILPYIEEQALYEQFNLEEPWDSPHNMAVAEQMPELYRCPSASGVDLTTPYVVFNEPGGIFDGEQETAFNEVIDGLSNTLMVIEYGSSNIQWNEPRDVTLQEMPFPVSDHPTGANAALADGAVRFLPETIDRQTFQNMVTRGGGETVDVP